MKVFITMEVEVEVELEHEPASRGERGYYGELLEPDSAENLEVQSFTIITPGTLTESQEQEALKLGWNQIESARNSED